MHGSKADHTASPPLAERLDPDRLLLTEPVRQIYYDENAVTVTTDRYDIHARRCWRRVTFGGKNIEAGTDTCANTLTPKPARNEA